jgi:hypothetical protein
MPGLCRIRGSRPASGYNDGFNTRELPDILSLVAANREGIASAWNEFFGKGDGRQV